MLRIRANSADSFRGVEMKARLAVAGSVMAGLVAVGGVAVASTWQPVQAPAPRTVEFVQPAAVVSTIDPTVAPTETATVAPVVVPTTDPVAAPSVLAPAPVESAVAPAPVVAPTSEVIVPKPVVPAEAPGTSVSSIPSPTLTRVPNLQDGPDLAPNIVCTGGVCTPAPTPTP